MLQDVERSLQELEDMESSRQNGILVTPESSEQLTMLSEGETIQDVKKSNNMSDFEGIGVDLKDRNSSLATTTTTASTTTTTTKKEGISIQTVGLGNNDSSKRNNITFEVTSQAATPTNKPRFLSVQSPTKSFTLSLFRSFSLTTGEEEPPAEEGSQNDGKDRRKLVKSLSTRTLLDDAVKGRTKVDSLLPISERIYKIAKGNDNTLIRIGLKLFGNIKGKYYFNLFRLRQEFSELFEWNSTSMSSLKPVSYSSTSRRQKKESGGDGDRFPLDAPPFLSHSKNNGLIKFLASVGEMFRAVLKVFVYPSDLSLHATTQYRSISEDLKLLEAPEFEVSLRRKMATVQRMRVSYKCLAPVT